MSLPKTTVQRRSGRKESQPSKRSHKNINNLLLLRDDLDFYRQASSNHTTHRSILCPAQAEDEDPASGLRRLESSCTGCQPLGLQLGLCSRFMLPCLQKQEPRKGSPLAKGCHAARIESHMAFLTQKFEAETSHWL